MLKGKKKHLCRAVDALGLNGALLAVARRTDGGRPPLPILAYHRVVEETDINSPAFPFEELNVSSFSHEFERQMEFISRRFRTITFSDLKKHVNGVKGELPLNPIIITFDDGYKDNHTIAFPILKKFGLKAVFFPVTSLVGGRFMEIERLSYSVKTSAIKELDLSDAGLGRLSLRTWPDRVRAKNVLTHELRRHGEQARSRLADLLFERLGAELPPCLGARMMLDWSEIREMADCGMEIGSHSASHPILSRISDERLREEVEGSRKELESRIGTEVCAFSYPAGGKIEYVGEKVKLAVKEAGYSFGISYFNGLEKIGSLDPYCLKRLRISRYVDMPLFKAGLAIPWMLV